MAAHIYTGQVSYGQNEWADAMYNFIHQYDNRITKVDDTILQFSDKFKVNFRTTVSGQTAIPLLDMNGNQLTSYSRNSGANYTRSVTLIADTNFLCYKEETFYKWFWIMLDGENYFSFMFNSTGSDGSGNYEIDNEHYNNTAYNYGKFTKIEDSSVKNFRIPKNFPYSVISPKIMFSDTAVIINSSGEAKKINFLKTCSTVPLESNVAVNNKNYYAIGTNTLIEVEA